jgi:hypothetical protein
MHPKPRSPSPGLEVSVRVTRCTYGCVDPICRSRSIGVYSLQRSHEGFPAIEPPPWTLIQFLAIEPTTTTDRGRAPKVTRSVLTRVLNRPRQESVCRRGFLPCRHPLHAAQPRKTLSGRWETRQPIPGRSRQSSLPSALRRGHDENITVSLLLPALNPRVRIECWSTLKKGECFRSRRG